jgi:hypothetical protein
VGAAGLAALAAVAFVPSLWAGFVADDYAMLRTAGRFGGLGWALGHNDLGQPGSAGHFYRPVWVLWDTGISRAFSDSAVAFHAGNLVLFVLITLEVWLLVSRFVDGRRAWIGAAAFALYPRHAESVAWISGSTDLVATLLALGALLVLLASWPVWLRAGAAGALAGSAALAKEVTFVLPLLAAILLLLAARRSRATAKEALPALGAIVLAQAAVVVARTAVLGGAGGYTAYPWTPGRVAGVLATYLTATLSPPQLELLRHPVFLAVPAALAALVGWRIGMLRRQCRRDELAAVTGGIAWFLVALLPSLNLAIDLNNANGERLLFLPSVGLALALAALVRVPAGRLRRPAFAAAGLVLLLLTLQATAAWVSAGRLADRVLSEAAALAPSRGTLVLLSVPEAYRNAHVFPGSLDAALAYRRRGDVRVVLCLPVQVVHERARTIAFGALPDGSYRATTTWDAPFDFPVLRGSTASISPDCGYRRADGKRWPLGVGLVGQAYPTLLPRSRLTYFDGRDLRRYR